MRNVKNIKKKERKTKHPYWCLKVGLAFALHHSLCLFLFPLYNEKLQVFIKVKAGNVYNFVSHTVSVTTVTSAIRVLEPTKASAWTNSGGSISQKLYIQAQGLDFTYRSHFTKPMKIRKPKLRR